MSVGLGGEPSHAAPTGVARGVPANSDMPFAAAPGAGDPGMASRHRSAAGWRVLLVGTWALLMAVFILGEPARESARHWWVDGAWTITYLATTLFSLWTALKLSGRDRVAWGLFAAASGSWFVGQLIWNYYELAAHIETPFPAFSDLFFLLFAP